MTTPVRRLARRSAGARQRYCGRAPPTRGNRDLKLDTTPPSCPDLPCEPQLRGHCPRNLQPDGTLSLRVLIAETGPVTERLRVRQIDDDEGRRLVRIIRRGSG
jgi:hypothetical protein